ncbi:unnamed protein product [Strongylus vulgaris]|uniref:glutathione synthase n=1 Tax=Strongylus vulgaris TaxID=40348 RepID=A0A3P7M2I2_STRVU|nr:unnamed protein product [Strongylus vulgaris]
MQVANTKKTQQVRPLLISQLKVLKVLCCNFSHGCSFYLLQVLAEDGMIERFVGHPRDAAAIRATFAGLWSINGDDPITKKLIKNAVAHPSRFVLKPQLEGGAGNFYGEKMAEKLKNMEKDELGAFILMERVQPLVVENYLIRAMQPVQLSKVVSELGVYGYALGDRGMAEVRQGGHLLRTKGEDVDEVRVPCGPSFKTFRFFHNYGENTCKYRQPFQKLF